MLLNAKDITVQNVHEEVRIVLEVAVVEIHETAHVLDHASHVVHVKEVLRVQMFWDTSKVWQSCSPLRHTINDHRCVLMPGLVHGNALGHIRFTTVLVELLALRSSNRQMLVEWPVVLSCVRFTKTSQKKLPKYENS